MLRMKKTLFAYIHGLCIIMCVIHITWVEAASWKQFFHKNSTRYRTEDENCSTHPTCTVGVTAIQDNCIGEDSCSGGYGFKLGTSSKCPEQNNIKENKCPKRFSEKLSIDCGVTKYKCQSGQCVDLDALCDGHPDCSDNSDETQQQCSELNCIDSFRCSYGACVNNSARCNGIKECFDGSDEEICDETGDRNIANPQKPFIVNQPHSSIPGSCIIPTPPSHGKFINSNNPTLELQPGEFLPQFSALITTCDRQYKITSSASYPVCLNGKWTAAPPGCARFCPSANSTFSTKITCRLGRVLLDGCINPVEGTIATITCDPLYEGQSGNPTRVCRDGSWDYPIYECRPVCGQKTPKGTPNILGGQAATPGSYPWHVGIYANNELKNHLCGGSILNRRVIISAAHCFTDNDGVVLSKENYLIGAGKYYSPYGDDRDTNAQYASIHSIHVPDRYKGAIANYEADIAVAILMNALRISIAVQPVCVDWTTDFEYQQLSENNAGVVVGWGFTKKGEGPSIELKELTVPYVSYDQCFERVPKDFRRFLTYDKICAGFLYHGVAVCQGDSGGGLTFQRKYNERFYLRGIVSTSPRSENSCDPDQFATYTLVSRHIDFVRELETLYRL